MWFFVLLVQFHGINSYLVRYSSTPGSFEDDRYVDMKWENSETEFTFALISDSQIGMYDT